MPFHYTLSQLSVDHPGLPEEVFVPAFLAATNSPVARQSTFMIWFRRGTVGRPKKVKWVLTASSSITPAKVNSFVQYIPEKELTEWAAITVAAATLPRSFGLRFAEVTIAGERGDYWLSDLNGVRRKELCEVSGTLGATKIGRLYQKKLKQVRKNNDARRCFVSVSQLVSTEGYLCRVR